MHPCGMSLLVLWNLVLLTALVEWRMDQGQRQYSVDAELILPGLVGTQIFGLIQNSASLWSSALKLRYGLRGKNG